MDMLLSGLTGVFCLVYLDDIIIYSKTFEDHLLQLEKIFTRLRDANFHLRIEKCHFFCREVEYLGHHISAEGIRPLKNKLAAVAELIPPTDVKQIQQFLGLTGYYRRFVEGYAKLAAPLYTLLRKDVPFAWRPEHQKAFDALKFALINPPVLAYPDFSKPFIVKVDACKVGLGAVLCQEHDGSERPVCYYSRTLKGAEQNYTVTEQECLALVVALGQFRPYLYGNKFTIYTDHSALQWLRNINMPNSRLTRWALELQDYKFDVAYKKGSTHGDADALSRLPRLPRGRACRLSGVSPPPGVAPQLAGAACGVAAGVAPRLDDAAAEQARAPAKRDSPSPSSLSPLSPRSAAKLSGVYALVADEG